VGSGVFSMFLQKHTLQSSSGPLSRFYEWRPVRYFHGDTLKLCGWNYAICIADKRLSSRSHKNENRRGRESKLSVRTSHCSHVQQKCSRCSEILNFDSEVKTKRNEFTGRKNAYNDAYNPYLVVRGMIRMSC